MAAAERVFLEHGFADATTLMVAKQAGASKETIYRHFRSKEELFAAVIDSRSKWLSEELDAGLSRTNDLRHVLFEFGCRLLNCMAGTDVFMLARVVIAESQRNPELGRLFLKHGPERTLGRLAHYLEGARGRGEFSGDDPRTAARLFISVVLSNQLLLNLCRGVPAPLSQAEMDAQVQTAVAVFFAYYT